MYQALYRKWRPQTFDDVVGQDHITETLKRQIEGDRLSHAYLFVGTRGTGKTTCAKILAKAANCEHPVGGNPCNACKSCIGIDNGSILDVEELDAASNTGVDNIRMLRDEAIYTPASVRKRVYIIDEVHMLSTSAFNALLKILEEPPEHLIFILATTELYKVPATILSRCQRFSFKRITPVQIAGRLKYVAEKEGLNLTDDGAELLASLAEGSLRDALSLLDQCIWNEAIDRDRVMSVVGLAGTEDIISLTDKIATGDVSGCLEIFDKLYSEGKDVASVLSELLVLYRDILVLKVAGKGGERLVTGRFDSKSLDRLAAKTKSRSLMRGVSVLEDTLSSLSRSEDVKISAEMCIIELSDETISPDIAGLEARISRLEEGVVPSVPKKRTVAAESRDLGDVGESTKGQVIVSKIDVDDVPFDTSGAKRIGSNSAAARSESMNRPEEVQTTKADDKDGNLNEDAGQWQKILAVLKDKIEKPPYTFISNEIHASAKISGGDLIIGTKSVIAKNLINTSKVKLAVKESAEQILGHPVTVIVDDFKEESKDNIDKLDSLRKFGNIKFE